MSMSIYPTSELRFRGPYTIGATTSLFLSNLSDQWLAFKLTCTHPDHYRATPPSGFVPSRGEISIVLDMLPLPADMTLDAYLAGTQKFKVEWRTLAEKPGPNETAENLLTKGTGGPVNETKRLCRFDLRVIEKSPSYASVRAPAVSGDEQMAMKLIGMQQEIVRARWLVALELLFLLVFIAIHFARLYEMTFEPEWITTLKANSKWSGMEQLNSKIFRRMMALLYFYLLYFWFNLMNPEFD